MNQNLFKIEVIHTKELQRFARRFHLLTATLAAGDVEAEAVAMACRLNIEEQNILAITIEYLATITTPELVEVIINV